jgi:hypothetical protein
LYFLTRHENRKTSCEPIQGDPLKPYNDVTCHFCYKEFKNKYILKTHYKTCKIKNGVMKLLFEKIKKIEKKLCDVEKERNYYKKNSSIKTINNYNTNFNFTVINFNGMESQKLLRSILKEKLPSILTREFKEVVPQKDQIYNRISEIVKLAHRNPDCKGLQNVYVDRPNAFVYDSAWIADNWEKIQKSLLASICNNAMLDYKPTDEPRDPYQIGHIMQKHAKMLHNINATKKESEDLSIKLAEELSLKSIHQ